MRLLNLTVLSGENAELSVEVERDQPHYRAGLPGWSRQLSGQHAPKYVQHSLYNELETGCS